MDQQQITQCGTSLETLLDLYEGRIDDDPRAAETRRHVESGCAACRERLEWIARVLAVLPEALRADAAGAIPSPAALDYARGLARLLRPATGGGAAAIRRHVARLVSGGTPRPAAAAGARGSAAAPAVQRVFETDDHVISLWDEPDEDGGAVGGGGAARRYLIGQVYARGVGPDADRAALEFRSVVLLPAPAGSGDMREAEREGDEFHFGDVAPGVYLVRCVLSAGDEEILLPRVEVGLA